MARQSKLPETSNYDKEKEDGESQYDNELLLDKQSQRSGSQHSIASSNNNAMETEAASTKIKSPAVDELLAKHPGIDFTAE